MPSFCGYRITAKLFKCSMLKYVLELRYWSRDFQPVKMTTMNIKLNVYAV